MADALARLPPDDTVAIPKDYEANFSRRSLLYELTARLRLELNRLTELESKLQPMQDWIAILQGCRHELEERLAAAEDAQHDKTSRSYWTLDSLRHSLRDVMNGPELVNGREFSTEILMQWLADHAVHPLPGETGIFTGRGGLKSAERRLDEVQHRITDARADVERTLHVAMTELS